MIVGITPKLEERGRNIKIPTLLLFAEPLEKSCGPLPTRPPPLKKYEKGCLNDGSGNSHSK